MNEDVRKGLIRHKFVYHFLRILIGWPIVILRNFSYEYYRIKGKPVLFLSNHNTDFDPLLMVISLKKHFRFVASANIMSGPIGKIIRFLVGPIPREKGSDADRTVELIIENLNAGIDVAMFSEGNKSWDGLTGFISRRTADILKKARCGLVTYRFDGGYLRSPRWARYPRRGRMFGGVVNEYSYEQLKDLSEDEIYRIIVTDMRADAYEFQDKHHIRYRGKALAEGIENLTYLCPVCQRFDTIRTKGNEFFCDCGMRAVYDEYGYLNGDRIPEYDNTIKWNSFQKRWLLQNRKRLKEETETPFSHNEDLCLYRIVDNERILLKDAVNTKLYGDRIVVADDEGFEKTFYWKDMAKTAMFRNTGVYFTCHDERYELYRSSGFSLIKYFSLWRVLTDKDLV